MIEEYNDQELRQIAEWVASDGLLRTDEQLMREIFEILPFQRMGGRIRERLLTIAQKMRLRQSHA